MLPSWTRIDRGRFELAVEALRKARTDVCFDGYSGPDDAPSMSDESHQACPSLFLDGFSVDEVTAAEEALT